MTNNIWFCSDHHINHKNILEFERFARPFDNLTDMHEALIERHNAIVKPNDIVYFLGDFSFGKTGIAMAQHFNGKKRLVLGNHDAYPAAEYLKYFEKLYGAKFWEQCLLTHVPVHPSNINGYRCKLNIHGHMHSKEVAMGYDDGCGEWVNVADERYFNVSVERHNLTPVHADIIRDHIVKQINIFKGIKP